MARKYFPFKDLPDLLRCAVHRAMLHEQGRQEAGCDLIPKDRKKTRDVIETFRRQLNVFLVEKYKDRCAECEAWKGQVHRHYCSKYVSIRKRDIEAAKRAMRKKRKGG